MVLCAAAVVLCAVVSGSSGAWGAGDEAGSAIELSCAGKLAEGGFAANGAKGSAVAVEASARFGEGGVLALVDPETRKVDRPLYDAEATSGPLLFSDGDATTIVWTRMSGREGPLLGQAVLSDGNVLALSIGRPSESGRERPFTLYLAGDGSLYRGVCALKQCAVSAGSCPAR